MIELDERDIKEIGRSRFLRKNDKNFSFVLIGFLLVVFVLLFLTGDTQTNMRLLPLIPLLGLLVYAFWYFRSANKAAKVLLKQWEESKKKK